MVQYLRSASFVVSLKTFKASHSCFYLTLMIMEHSTCRTSLKSQLLPSRLSRRAMSRRNLPDDRYKSERAIFLKSFEEQTLRRVLGQKFRHILEGIPKEFSE